MRHPDSMTDDEIDALIAPLVVGDGVHIDAYELRAIARVFYAHGMERAAGIAADNWCATCDQNHHAEVAIRREIPK